MSHDALHEFERTSLERLRLAADVILAEADAIPAALEVELTLFRERVEHALLLPDQAGDPAQPAGATPPPSRGAQVLVSVFTCMSVPGDAGG